MRFSQRRGITPIKKAIQFESIDEDLKNGLWNALSTHCWSYYESGGRASPDHSNLVRCIWADYFKKPVDLIAYKPWYYCRACIREFFDGAKWWEVYDFIEFIAGHRETPQRERFINECNFILEREKEVAPGI